MVGNIYSAIILSLLSPFFSIAIVMPTVTAYCVSVVSLVLELTFVAAQPMSLEHQVFNLN